MKRQRQTPTIMAQLKQPAPQRSEFECVEDLVRQKWDLIWAARNCGLELPDDIIGEVRSCVTSYIRNGGTFQDGLDTCRRFITYTPSVTPAKQRRAEEEAEKAQDAAVQTTRAIEQGLINEAVQAARQAMESAQRSQIEAMQAQTTQAIQAARTATAAAEQALRETQQMVEILRADSEKKGMPPWVWIAAAGAALLLLLKQ